MMQPRSARADRMALIAALSAAAFAHGLMQSFLNPLLPTLRVAYGADPAAIAWLVTGFLLASSIVMPIAGRLGDMFGRARVLRIVVLGFVGGAILAALADSYALMLIARTVQGAAGALFPLAFGLLRERLSGRAMVGGIGFVSSMIAVGSGLAVTVAGPIVAALGLRSVFVIGAIVVTTAGALVWLLVPVGDTRMRPGRVDVLGAILLAGWLSGVLLAITQTASWGLFSAPSIALVLGTVVLFAVWVVVERRVSVPIVDMRLLSSAPVAWANLLAFLFGFLMFAGMITIPAFVQSSPEGGFGFGASIAETAIYLLPQTVVFLVASLLASTMYRWPGSRASIVIGVVFAVAGASGFVLWHHAPLTVVAASGVMGAGIGLIYAHLTSVIVATVPEGEVGSASGMNTNIRNIGGAFGSQVCGGLLTLGGELAFTLAFVAVAAAAVLALVPALAIAALGREADGPVAETA